MLVRAISIFRLPILFALLVGGRIAPGVVEPPSVTGVGQAISIPDTLDWHGYFPLQIGNVWQYDIHAWDFISEADWIRQWRVVAETTHTGEPWFVLETRCETIEVSDPFFDPCLGYEVGHWLVRYDEDRAGLHVLWRAPDGAYRDASIYNPDDIALDTPFDTTQTGTWGIYHFSREVEARLANGTVIPTTVKFVDIESAVPGVMRFAHGVGFLGSGGGEGGETTMRLRYASVGGESWGSHYPVGVEGAPVLPTAIARLAVYPNPATDRVTVSIDIVRAAPVSVRLFDTAGRLARSVARSRMLPAGPSTITADLSGLAPGVYILDVTDGSKRATRILVVHR